MLVDTATPGEGQLWYRARPAGRKQCTKRRNLSLLREMLCKPLQGPPLQSRPMLDNALHSIGPQDSAMLGRRKCCIRDLEICCSSAMLHLRVSTGPSTLADGVDFPLHLAGDCFSCIAGQEQYFLLLERCVEEEHMGSWPGMGRSYNSVGSVEQIPVSHSSEGVLLLHLH